MGLSASMQGRFRWSSTISPPDASGRRRVRMTYHSEGVPFGSVAAYRPGRPRSGDTAMTRQGWDLKEFGEYRTQRYMLAAFDQLSRGETLVRPLALTTMYRAIGGDA